MTVNSIHLKFPMYTVRSKGTMLDQASPIGCFQDQTSGERLGLLFTTQEHAKLFMLRSAIDQTANEVITIPNESRLVYMSRFLLVHKLVDSLVLNYGAGIEAIELPLDEIAHRVIPEDLEQR